jgi:hypothetical protein
MRRLAVLLATVTVAAVTDTPVAAYLKLGTIQNGEVVNVTWQQQPIRYFVSDYAGNGVSAADLRGALQRAGATWSAVVSASVRLEFQGMTSALPEVVDGRTTIGFLDRPDLDQVLGVTSFLLDSTTGAIVEADIFFNSRFVWSVSEAGTPGRVDLESVALHELGHLLGLGHSAIGETERTSSGGRRLIATGASMFPIAMMAGSVAERVLHADDVAGISDLYPATGAVERSGGIVGRVTKNGQGVLGAHVVAFNPETGVLIGNFALNTNGEFVIAMLPPGPYILRVEPVDDAEVESFLSTAVDLDFRVSYASRMVVAPEGGSSAPVEIRVSPK